MPPRKYNVNSAVMDNCNSTKYTRRDRSRAKH